MRAHPRRFHRPMLCVALLLGWVLLNPPAPAAQAPALASSASAAVDAASLSLDDREKFLATARIVKERSAPKGTTNTRRVTLSDGTMTHDASVQTIEEAKAVFQGTQGTELNFKDSWRFNVAAYRIDRLLSLGMIPATVERRHNGRSGSFTWWVDDVLMDEQERYRQKRQVPNTNDWNEQMWITRLFDQLIANVDRNLGNLLDRQVLQHLDDRSFPSVPTQQGSPLAAKPLARRSSRARPAPAARSRRPQAGRGRLPQRRRDRRPPEPPRSHRGALRQGRTGARLRPSRALLLNDPGDLRVRLVTVPASARAAPRARSARRQDRRRTRS